MTHLEKFSVLLFGVFLSGNYSFKVAFDLKAIL